MTVYQLLHELSSQVAQQDSCMSYTVYCRSHERSFPCEDFSFGHSTQTFDITVHERLVPDTKEHTVWRLGYEFLLQLSKEQRTKSGVPYFTNRAKRAQKILRDAQKLRHGG